MLSGWPADLTWYRLLTDWGSVIGGVFALIAGGIAFIGALWAARTQVRAIFAGIERPAVFVIQTQIRHPALLIRTVTREAVVRENRTNVAVEIDAEEPQRREQKDNQSSAHIRL